MWIRTDCQNEEDDNKLDQDAQIERGRHDNTSVELTTSVHEEAVIRDQPDSNRTREPPQNMTIRWERSNFI